MSEHKSRHTGKIACLAVIAAFAANTAFAQAAKWPERTITIVVASQPGAAPDVLARLVAEPLGTRLGQTVIVENRPGASGGIGAGFVARAEPDGYTLLMMTPVHSYGPAITPQTKYDPVKSFAPVSMIASVPLIMVSTPQIGAKTVSEFVDHAKKNPGKLNYTSPGMGTLQHLATVRFMKQAGIDMVHVPYKSGADAVVSLLGNTNHLFFCLDDHDPGVFTHITGRQTETGTGIDDSHHIATQVDDPQYVLRRTRHRCNFGVAQHLLDLHHVDAIGLVFQLEGHPLQHFVLGQILCNIALLCHLLDPCMNPSTGKISNKTMAVPMLSAAFNVHASAKEHQELPDVQQGTHLLLDHARQPGAFPLLMAPLHLIPMQQFGALQLMTGQSPG